QAGVLAGRFLAPRPGPPPAQSHITPRRGLPMSSTAAGRRTHAPAHRVLAVLALTAALAAAVGLVRTATARAATVGSTELTAGWALRSATGTADTGATISQVGYSTASWNPVTLPSTVLAGLVADNVYQNIYFGTNLKSV